MEPTDGPLPPPTTAGLMAMAMPTRVAVAVPRNKTPTKKPQSLQEAKIVCPKGLWAGTTDGKLILLSEQSARAFVIDPQARHMQDDRKSAFCTVQIATMGVMDAANAFVPLEAVVLKTFHTYVVASALARQPESENPFHELDLLRSIPPHQNIIPCLDIVETEQQLCVAYELAPGGDVFDLLARQPHRVFPEAAALPMFFDMALAVRHIHSHHVAHLDISLENFVIDAHGAVRLIDFGLAVSTIGQPLCVGTRGKPNYMAPEVVRAPCTFDPLKADVYSLGMCLLMMLAGAPLDANRVRSARDTNEIGDLVWQATEIAYSSRGVSADLIHVLRGMLEPNPATRWSIFDVCEELGMGY